MRTPLAAKPGEPAREDYEYERNGVAAIFCAVAPHVGWRRLEAREQKTRSDAGRYRFFDFFKVGALLTLVIYEVAILLVPRLRPI